MYGQEQKKALDDQKKKGSQLNWLKIIFILFLF